ncbi:MAG: hypothetical protein JSV86_04500 [Gemmatimonadota bacterium]|nr:MAG: hypothetical protein JSV86_04500 [Gemmatimonadota bacterium]
MARPDHRLSVRAARGLSQLRHRRDVEWLVLYLGGAWILYESVALTVDTFDLSVLVARVTALVLALGAILSIPLARWYELTARALESAGDEALSDVPGVPDMLEPALAGGYRRVRRRTLLVAGVSSALLFSVFFLALWNAWAAGHDRPATDRRVSLVVFPFRAGGMDASGYGEGIAAALYRSLAPPHSWYAYYTARAGLELGRIEELRGNSEEALRFYLMATRLWEHGEPDVVGRFLDRAREGLDRLRGELAEG